MPTKNLVLVHQNVQTDELLMSSLVKPENFLFNVSSETTTQEVLDAVQELGSLDNLALIYHYPGYSSLPFLRDPVPERDIPEPVEGEEPVEPTIPKKPTYYHISDYLVELLKELKNNKGLKNMDILTCDLNDIRFKEEMMKVSRNLGITINYSFNSIGHSVDWILESNGENIKEKYFNSGIDNWNKLLSGKVDLPTTNTEFISVEIGEENLKTYTLDKIIFDMNGIWSSDTSAKIIQNSVISINLWDTGTIRDRQTIEINVSYGDDFSYNSSSKTLNLVTDSSFSLELNDSFGDGWSGNYVKFIYKDTNDISNDLIPDLFLTGSSKTYDILKTKTVNVASKTYTLLQDCSLNDIGLNSNTYFSLDINSVFDGNGYTIDCSGYNIEGLFSIYNFGLNTNNVENYPTIKNLGVLNGNIISYGGGIVRLEQRFFKVENCYNTGAISNGAGGIAGSQVGYFNGTCTITNCYNTGEISGGAGGIAGVGAGYYGPCTITNCYNTGYISGSETGGIVGRNAGYYGECYITNCYNAGTISAYATGGIAGRFAGYNGTCTITNCYNTGAISGNNAGGIAGELAGYKGECYITNCYNTGAISGGNAGGIAGVGAGFNGGSCTITNCYTNLKVNTDENDRLNYVGSVASNAKSVTVSSSNDISTIADVSSLDDKFTTDSNYILDTFNNLSNANPSPKYPMLRGIFINFYRYDHYNAANLKLIINEIKNLTTSTELAAFATAAGLTTITDLNDFAVAAGLTTPAQFGDFAEAAGLTTTTDLNDFAVAAGLTTPAQFGDFAVAAGLTTITDLNDFAVAAGLTTPAQFGDFAEAAGLTTTTELNAFARAADLNDPTDLGIFAVAAGLTTTTDLGIFAAAAGLTTTIDLATFAAAADTTAPVITLIISFY